MRWMCEECGELHRKNSPPCDACGCMQFESTTEQVDPGPEEPIDGPVEWECENCGRRHPKRSPPCSRCGHMQLEAVEQRQDVDVDAGLSRRHVLGYGGAAVATAVGGGYLLYTSYLAETSAPTIEDVPGEADRASGIDLTLAAAALVSAVNDERTAADRGLLDTRETLREMAAYHCREMVKRGYFAYETRGVDLFEAFDHSCDAGNLLIGRYDQAGSIDGFDAATPIADRMVESWMDDAATREVVLHTAYGRIGADVHVDEDGSIYLTAVLC